MHFSECYRILGLTPGCQWNEVQASYRRLVQKWHPDRYPPQSEAQTEAGQRMQELNKAYTALSDYYRSQGKLPFETRAQDSTTAAQATAPSSRPDSRDPAADGRSQHAYQAPIQRPAREGVSTFSAWIAMALFAVIGYYVYLGFSIHQDETEFDQAAETETVTPAGTTKSQARSSYGNPYKTFGLGSTPGEVLEAQGIPTHTAGDLWFYGESEVYFEKGVVVSWQSRVGSPLNISATKGAATTSAAPKKYK